MAQALAQLQVDLSALYEEHDAALALSDEYKDAGPGDAIYDDILSEHPSISFIPLHNVCTDKLMCAHMICEIPDKLEHPCI